MYLFLAVLGLRCCAVFFLVAVSGGPFLVVVRGLLITVASSALGHVGFSGCGFWALEHRVSRCSASDKLTVADIKHHQYHLSVVCIIFFTEQI